MDVQVNDIVGVLFNYWIKDSSIYMLIVSD